MMHTGWAMKTEPTTVARAIAVFLRDLGSDTAFVVAGGASLHLIHAFADTPGCSYVPMHHEQSAAMAADGFTRSCGRVGIAVATSGPGATNLITGIAGCYYDSVPAIFLTGQVSTTRMTGSTGVRQIGFQETPITEMVKSVTKGSFKVYSAQDLRNVLEEAYWTATSGRPGPVLIDVPDDVQRQEINWDSLPSFNYPSSQPHQLARQMSTIQLKLSAAERPVLVGGAGVVLAGAEEDFRTFAEVWGAPVAMTWGAAHLLPHGHPLSLGTFGTHGNRHANFAIQNSDLVLSIGSRLDTKATGSPINSFARAATRIMVDIDAAELAKFQSFDMSMHHTIQADAADFLKACQELRPPVVSSSWTDYCSTARATCNAFDEERRVGPGINPYKFMAGLGSSSPRELDIFVDTGCVLPWIMAAFPIGRQQRIFHDLNNTAMGWSLPATIGASIASAGRANLCIIGDGSLMMTMHDLVTLARVNESARVVVLDNSGYAMIQQTQDQWLGSAYHSSSLEGGLRFPDYKALSDAHGFAYLSVHDPEDLETAFAQFWRAEEPVLLRVKVDSSWRVAPQVRFGRPNEDMEPLLPREIFEKLMIVPPMAASMEIDE